jgi:hypothetical protein
MTKERVFLFRCLTFINAAAPKNDIGMGHFVASLCGGDLRRLPLP